MQKTLAVVRTGAIVANARALQSAAKRPLIAVVKDDAYGHGAATVAHALCGIASAFAVSTADEGAALRIAGVPGEILVLTPPLDEEDAVRAAAYGLTVTLASRESLQLAARAGGGTAAHLAVNTGMNRYGFAPDAVGAACRAAQRAGICVRGVYSHYFMPAVPACRAAQRAAFARAVRCVRTYFPQAIAHLSATGGLLCGCDGFDAVRAGIALYGYVPQGVPHTLALRRAMRVYARVAQSGTAFGRGAGYGCAPRGVRAFHTLRLGYGDGFFRAGGLGAVGNLCMDACVRPGGRPFGAYVCVMQDAEAYARAHGTTAYEVLVHVGRAAQRRYI